jgi:chemotaxis protein methyltransferase CheR
MDQVRALVCSVMPVVARAAGRLPIRIWSVPCATGEEPLTIAMALDEGGWFNRATIEIHGSDGSTAAIAKAQSGHYRPRSLRALPQPLVEKYFVERDGSFTPVPSLRERVVSWSVVNLMCPAEVAGLAASPVIFCRNAFIYFSLDSVRQVVNVLADHMPTPGYLFVGASESLVKVTDRFMLDDIDRAFVYVKR